MELIFLDANAHVPISPNRILAPAELERYGSFNCESGRRDYLLGRLLLKTALTNGDYRRVRDFGMITTTMTPEGKPTAAGAEFSLSHDDGAVLLAIGDEPVGVDMETVQEFNEPMLRLCFDDTTRRAISRSRRPDRSATLAWCLKESAAKATGAGVLPLLKRPVPDGLYTRGGFLRSNGRERAYAICSTAPLPACSVIRALPRFRRAFAASAP